MENEQMDLNFEVKTLVHFFFLYFWEFYFPVVIKRVNIKRVEMEWRLKGLDMCYLINKHKWLFEIKNKFQVDLKSCHGLGEMLSKQASKIKSGKKFYPANIVVNNWIIFFFPFSECFILFFILAWHNSQVNFEFT